MAGAPVLCARDLILHYYLDYPYTPDTFEYAKLCCCHALCLLRMHPGPNVDLSSRGMDALCMYESRSTARLTLYIFALTKNCPTLPWPVGVAGQHKQPFPTLIDLLHRGSIRKKIPDKHSTMHLPMHAPLRVRDFQYKFQAVRFSVVVVWE